MGYVAVLGIFVADATFRAERMPKIGETLLGRSFALGPGGKGSNQAVAAAKAGAEVKFISKLGNDTFGDMATKLWDEAGVTPAVIRDENGFTGAASIFVDDESGNNAIIVCAGAAGDLSAADMQSRRAEIENAAVFVTQLEQPVDAALEALRIARGGGATTILNPAPAAQIPQEMLSLSDIVTPNESEAEALTGIAVETVEDAALAAQALLDKGAGAALLTLGGQGCFYSDGIDAYHVPAISHGPVVETTGAGDAFNGGLACALANGADIRTAIDFATATAAISVTRPGAAASMPDAEEIASLLSGQGG